MKTVHPKKRVTLVHSHDNLLTSEPLPEDFKEKALELLLDTGVEVIMNRRVVSEEALVKADGSGLVKVIFSNGESIIADNVMWAVGKTRPNTEFLPQEALNEKTGLVQIRSTYVSRHTRFLWAT